MTPGPLGLRGILGQRRACIDLLSASKSPMFALFEACFGLFWPQVGVPPKWPISGLKIAKMISPQKVLRNLEEDKRGIPGQFGPILRVKGGSRAQAGVGEGCALTDNR